MQGGPDAYHWAGAMPYTVSVALTKRLQVASKILKRVAQQGSKALADAVHLTFARHPSNACMRIFTHLHGTENY